MYKSKVNIFEFIVWCKSLTGLLYRGVRWYIINETPCFVDMFAHLQSKLCCLLGVPILLNSSVDLDGEKKGGNINPGLSCVYFHTPCSQIHNTTHMSSLHYPLFCFLVDVLSRRIFFKLFFFFLAALLFISAAQD